MNKEEILDKIDTALEAKAENTKDVEKLIESTDTLKTLLPEIKKRIDDCKQHADDCDSQIKTLQDFKKTWSGRSATLTEMVKNILLKLKTKTITEGDNRATVGIRHSLVTNDELIMKDYSDLILAVECQLPPYIKVKCSIDKTELGNYLKMNPEIMAANPEKAYWTTTNSITIK